ncbi:MAG: PPK2 family polyphosphate kinase [Bacteroidota bacterium]
MFDQLPPLRFKSGVELHNFPTLPADVPSKKSLKEGLSQVRVRLSEFQERLYAHKRHSVLICLQGMDTSGKDSLVREVFKDFNSRGVVVHSFGKPSTKEYKHDFLWRHYIALPERGKFAVFNRSHYENVLISRVHPKLILNENLPKIKAVEDIPEDFWQQRFEQIRNFEQHITQNGVLLFKFFLHISKEEQRERLIRRLNRPEKLWKFDPSDISERQHWDAYQDYNQEMLQETHSKTAPWYVIPSDSKHVARLLVAQILDQVLSSHTHIQAPPWDAVTQGNIEEALAALGASKKAKGRD